MESGSVVQQYFTFRILLTLNFVRVQRDETLCIGGRRFFYIYIYRDIYI